MQICRRFDIYKMIKRDFIHYIYLWILIYEPPPLTPLLVSNGTNENSSPQQKCCQHLKKRKSLKNKERDVSIVENTIGFLRNINRISSLKI